jgi:hypothetical protein
LESVVQVHAEQHSNQLKETESKECRRQVNLLDLSQNSSMWFDNWEHDIVELGFGTCNKNHGEGSYPPWGAALEGWEL